MEVGSRRASLIFAHLRLQLGGSVPTSVRRLQHETRGSDGSIAEEEEQEKVVEEEGVSGKGRVVVSVSSCRFPRSQPVFSLTSPLNQSSAVRCGRGRRAEQRACGCWGRSGEQQQQQQRRRQQQQYSHLGNHKKFMFTLSAST